MTTPAVAHGPMNCRRCWTGCNDNLRSLEQARIVNDPGHWGATDPKILILGISKGNTQARAFREGEFDRVAFDGIRHRLLEALQAVGLLDGENLDRFERRFRPGEQDIAFASLIRCSLTAWNNKKAAYSADSPDIMRALRQPDVREVAEACASQHLGQLSPRTKLVVMLGNSPGYMKIVRELVRRVRGRVDDVNEVAFDSNGVRFVHLTHPSRLNGHFNAFVTGTSSAGRKLAPTRDAVATLLQELR